MTARSRAVVVAQNPDAANTKACVESILVSEAALEVAVVAAGPGGADAVSGISGVEVLQTATGADFYAAADAGFRWALADGRCEFVLLMTADMRAAPDAVLMLEAALDERPRAGIVSPRIVFAEDHSRLYYARGFIDWKSMSARVEGVGGSSTTTAALYGKALNFAFPGAMMLKREVLQALGGFDEAFELYGADVDFSLRAIEAGFRIFYAPDATFFHDAGSNRELVADEFRSSWLAEGGDYERRMFRAVWASVVNARRHAGGGRLIMFFALFPPAALWRAFRASLRLGPGAFGPVWRGLSKGLKHPDTSA